MQQYLYSNIMIYIILKSFNLHNKYFNFLELWVYLVFQNETSLQHLLSDWLQSVEGHYLKL